MARARQGSKYDYCSPAWIAVAIFGALASCEGNGDVLLPSTKGGDGTVIRIPSDGGARDAAAGGATAHGSGGGGGHASGTGESPGTGGAGVGGAGVGGAGVGGMGVGGATSVGGAAGGGVADDPCTACEKKKCSNPVNGSDLLLTAYEICFLGTGVPAAALRGSYLPKPTGGHIADCLQRTDGPDGEDDALSVTAQVRPQDEVQWRNRRRQPDRLLLRHRLEWRPDQPPARAAARLSRPRACARTKWQPRSKLISFR